MGVDEMGCCFVVAVFSADPSRLLLVSEGLESVPSEVLKGRCLGFELSVINLFESLHSPPVLSTAIGKPFLSENTVLFWPVSVLG